MRRLLLIAAVLTATIISPSAPVTAQTVGTIDMGDGVTETIEYVEFEYGHLGQRTRIGMCTMTRIDFGGGAMPVVQVDC